jgi:DNA-binding NarL/FixJ family response regulator
MPVNIFLVEDHEIMREMLQEFLSDEPELTVVGAAENAEEALDTLDGVPVDLVLVDVSLPGMSGIDFVRTLKVRRPGLPCLMLSGHAEESYSRRAMEAGARGYLTKGDPEDIVPAIYEVMRSASASGAMVHSRPLSG